MLEPLDRFGCRGSTIKLYNGKYLDYLSPDPNVIDIDTISHALAHACRFNGHVPTFYSVAEHSLLCWEVAFHDRCRFQREVLLHDAAEAFVGDMVKPLKQLLPTFTEIERRIEQAIALRFNLNPNAAAEVKKYDRVLLKAEKQHFWPDDANEWEGFDKTDSHSVKFREYVPKHARHRFKLIAESLNLR